MINKRKLYSLIAKLMIVVMLIPLFYFSSITTMRVSAAPSASGNATGNNPSASENNPVSLRWTQRISSGGSYITGSSQTMSGTYGGVGHPHTGEFVDGTALWIYWDFYGEGSDLLVVAWDDVPFQRDVTCTLTFDNTTFDYVNLSSTSQPYGTEFENMPNSFKESVGTVDGSNVALSFKPIFEGENFGYFRANRVEIFQWQSLIPSEGGYTPAMLQPLELTYGGNGHPLYSEGYGPATVVYYSNYFDDYTDLLYFRFDGSKFQPSATQSLFSVRFKNIFGHTSVEEYGGPYPDGTSVPTAVGDSESVDGEWINLLILPRNEGRNYIFYKAKRSVSATGVTLNKTQTSMWPNTSEKLVATVTPADAADKEVLWTSSNDYIASVNEEGLVSASHPGIVTVTATTHAGGYTASCNVTVQAEMPDPSIRCSVDGVILEWEDQDVTSYRIYRKAGSGTWERLEDIWGTSYIDHEVVSGTKYSYYVMALDDESYVEISPYDKNKVKTVVYYRLDPPHLTLTQVSGGINVSWEEMPDVERYRVYRKTASGNWTAIKYTTGLSYKDTKVEGDTVYTYGVQCISADGKYLNELVEGGMIFYIDYTPIVTLSQDNAGVQISWGEIEEAVKYRVYRRTEGGQWTKLATVKELSYEDTNVENGTEYMYGIQCLDASGTALNKVVEGGRILYKKNYTPTITLEQNYTGVQISWSEIEEAVKYRVYRRTETGSWTKLATVKELSYEDTNVENGTEYIYGIQCVDASGAALNKIVEGGRILVN